MVIQPQDIQERVKLSTISWTEYIGRSDSERRSSESGIAHKRGLKKRVEIPDLFEGQAPLSEITGAQGRRR